MYAFGFDSPILSIFSYPQGAVKKLTFFYSPFVFYRLIFISFNFRSSFHYGSRFVRYACGRYDNLFDGLVRRNVEHYLCYRALDY